MRWWPNLIVDEGRTPRKSIEPGLRVGILAGVMFGVVQILVARATAGDHYWLYPVQWLGYLFVAQIAAASKYRAQQGELDALAGVKLAGTGAGMVSSLIVWVMLMGAWLGFDLLPKQGVVFNPGLFFVAVIVDVGLAIGIGTRGGAMVVAKHRNFLD